MGISALLAAQILDASATGRSVITGADASAIRSTLGLGTLATQSPTGTPSASTFLRGDYSWQTINLSGYLPLAGGTMTGAINVPLGAAATESIRFASNTGIYSAGEGFVNLNANGMMQWNGAAGQLWLAVNSATTQLALGSSADVRIFRDAAQTLAQRNSTNAQTFRIYNTFTDASNYERAKIAWESSVLRIGTEKAGTGSARALELQTDGTTRLTISNTGLFTIADALNIAVGTTTGTKIGTATNQKLGFYNATPVVQPTAVENATDAASVITQLNALLSRMRDLGLIAT